MTIFQIVLDGAATGFIFDSSEKVKLVNKMIELQNQFVEVQVTFLIVNL